MIRVKVKFKRKSEDLKEYKVGQEVSHFTKKDEDWFIQNGYAERVETKAPKKATEKKEAAPRRKKRETNKK